MAALDYTIPYQHMPLQALVSLVFSKLISYCSTLFLAPEEFVSLAEMEDTLLRNLFRGYQKWVRPVLHANDTITVRFGLKISQLVDVVRHTHIHYKI